MADLLKIPKDKRHRSSSSLAAYNLDNTRSERKLNLKASIPEADDQFTIAEARCEELMEKIDLFKSLKRKKKMKKRSMTLVTEQPTTSTNNNPFIAVRTQPKKKMAPMPRIRRSELANPARGYVDPATVEQHRMIGQFRHKPRTLRDAKRNQESRQDHQNLYKTDYREGRAEGDASYARNYQRDSPIVVPYEDEDAADYSSEDQPEDDAVRPKKSADVQTVKILTRRRQGSKESAVKDIETKPHNQQHNTQKATDRLRQNQVNRSEAKRLEERPVVELFNKRRDAPPPEQAPSLQRRMERVDESTASVCDDHTVHLREPKKKAKSILSKDGSRSRRISTKHRTRSYELPTVSSQMKQAGIRHYYEIPNHSKLPFIISKSTSPSHNIGVNLQQVLNGFKMQQPVSGIPLTIAHHMGLGHVPTYGMRSVPMQPMLSTREINVIRAGSRLVRLPSYKYLSYKRLLNLYREGEGMVPRFLRAISKPHYFFSSMYKPCLSSLQLNREDDAATSKGRSSISQEAKQHLSEYAALYKEYEHVDKSLKENYEPERQRRKEELTRELLQREEQIRRVVTEYGSQDVEIPNLRASASITGDAYRHAN